MTREEKRRISEMRRQGLSYSNIAIALDIPAGTVKSFCWRNGLSDKELSGIAKKGEIAESCQNCGTAIVQKSDCRPRKFCSDKCRYDWWRHNRDKMKHQAIYTINCAGCHKEFESYGNPKRKYCCHDCFIKHRFREVAYDHGTTKPGD